MRIPRSVKERARRVKLLILDVDGVLTNGKVLIGEEGELKFFSVKNGVGTLLAQRAGLKVAIISARPSKATKRRAREMKIDELYQVKGGKDEVYQRILKRHGLKDEDVAYVGDDLQDLCILRRVGFAVAVPNGIEEVRALSHYTTNSKGGEGAVREVVEVILKAKGKWMEVAKRYLSFLLLMILLHIPSYSEGPKDEMEHFTLIEMHKGEEKWTLKGEREIPLTEERSLLEGIQFHLFLKGKKLTLRADRGWVDKVNRDFHVEGNVVVTSPTWIFRSESLDWMNSEERLFTEEKVEVEAENFNITGHHLEAYQGTRRMKLRDAFGVIKLKGHEERSSDRELS